MIQLNKILAFILLVGFVHNLSASSHIILNKIYHHRACSKLRNRLELGSIVFYFSSKPVIERVSSELIGDGCVKNIYILKGVCVPTQAMIATPLRNEHYTVVMRNVEGALCVVITYNSSKVALEFQTFDSISLQKGVALHFLNRMHGDTHKKLAPSKQKIVVIDPGHGGSDAGAIGCCGIKEKDIALSVALQVGQLLKKAGIQVRFTRSSDSTVLLDERTSYANQVNADLFLSIHANYAQNKSAQGIDTFCMQASLLHSETNINDGHCSNALNQLLQIRAKESKKLANIVHQSVITGVRSRYPMVVDRKVKYEVAQILLGSQMPALLIEIGFVSHEVEAKRLSDQEYQRLLAASIYDGIIAYLKE